MNLAGWFWRHATFPFREVFANEDAALQRARLLVRITYAFWVYTAALAIRNIAAWNEPPLGLLWPVAWMQQVPWHPGLYMVAGIAATGTLLAAFFPQVLLFRVLALIGILEMQGLRYSYDKINHGYHMWVLAALLLVFLPRLDAKPSANARRGYLEVAWGVQALALGCYTLAGMQKLWGAALDWAEDGVTVFHPDALSLFVARVTIAGDGGGLLAWPVIHHPYVGYPLMLGALFLELCAIGIIFRPHIQPFWAGALMLMHFGIGLTMYVWFEPLLFFLAVWFLSSPFMPARLYLESTLREIPWLGPPIAAAISRARRSMGHPPDETIIYYDGDCGVCNSFVQFVLKRGLPPEVQFASQTGQHWQRLIHEKPYLQNRNTVVIYTRRGEEQQAFIRSEGVFWMMSQMGGIYQFGWLAMLVPLPLLNLGYRVVARNRGLLSKLTSQQCTLPTPELKTRLLD